MTPPLVQIQGGGLQFNANLASMSLSDVGQCKLADHFNFSPVGSLSDPEAKLSAHLIGCVWGDRGHIWLEQSLTLGGTFHLLHSGGEGSIALDNALFIKPMKELQIMFRFIINGTLDSSTGFHGSMSFNGDMKLIDSKANFAAIGLKF